MKCSACDFDNVIGSVYCTKCNNTLNTTAPSMPPVAPDIKTVSPQPSAAQPAPAAPPVQPVAPAPSISTPATSSAPYAPPQSSPPAYPAAVSRPAQPYPYQQPSYVYPPYAQKEKQPFTITDAYIVIGFVLAVVGVFSYAFLLLPISIGFSVVGFVKRTNSRTHGLSLAGIVVGVVACLIKVGLVLNELGLIPDWLSAGIF